jgi:hypothetical protein
VYYLLIVQHCVFWTMVNIILKQSKICYYVQQQDVLNNNYNDPHNTGV